jgi:hypothetical protein
MLTSLDYYRIFYYVAKYRNFTRAADVLLTSQPTVTRTIKNLESDLGCRLFIRGKRGVTLTTEGELLYSYIAPAYEKILKGEEKLGGETSLQGGSVYVSATETSLHCFLLEKLGLFHDRHPQIRLKITNVSTTQAIENVVSGRSDFAFVASPAEAPSPLKQTDLHPFRDILIGNANYIELAHGSYRLKDLKKYPLISLSRSASSAYIFYQAVYAKAGLEFRPDIELNTSDLIIPFIRRNLGVGFVPEELALPALRAGEIVKIHLKEEIPERIVSVVYNPHYPLSAAAKELLRLVRQGK